MSSGPIGTSSDLTSQIGFSVVLDCNGSQKASVARGAGFREETSWFKIKCNYGLLEGVEVLYEKRLG
jgi:hypothetical protein